MAADADTPFLRMEFYYSLSNIVEEDFDKVCEEWEELYRAASDLGQREHKWLDSYEGMSGIEEELKRGNEIPKYQAGEIRQSTGLWRIGHWIRLRHLSIYSFGHLTLTMARI